MAPAAENWRAYFKQAREETGLRLLEKCYTAEGGHNKYWMAFSSRKFLNKTIWGALQLFCSTVHISRKKPSYSSCCHHAASLLLETCRALNYHAAMCPRLLSALVFQNHALNLVVESLAFANPEILSQHEPILGSSCTSRFDPCNLHSILEHDRGPTILVFFPLQAIWVCCVWLVWGRCSRESALVLPVARSWDRVSSAFKSLANVRSSLF